MRIILLAFFLTFTWAVLAKEETVDYKIVSAKTHSRAERILVLDIVSEDFGTEYIWVYFNGTDHAQRTLELFEKKGISYLQFIEREGRTVFNSDEVKIYTNTKNYIGNLDRLLPRKSMKDRFVEFWNEESLFPN